MTVFKFIIELLSIGFIALGVFILQCVLMNVVGKLLITAWFKEKEEYVKRMSLLPDHEYEKVN